MIRLIFVNALQLFETTIGGKLAIIIDSLL